MLHGIATNINRGNSFVRSSSVAQPPSTKLPPEEKGEIALL